MLKNLLVFFNPLGFTWLLLTVWLLLVLWRRRWGASVLPAIAWFTLTLSTCTPFNSWLLGFYENDYPIPKLESVPACDVIVCLGGGAEPSVNELTGIHLTRAADRLMTAIMLASQKKGTVLVIGGGMYKHQGQGLSEADMAGYFLQRQRATDLRIVSLGVCADTHDEAVKTAQLAQVYNWKSVALVTSASHMKRAVGTFEKVGLKVVPVPCNYQSSFYRVGNVRYLHLPHEGGLTNFVVWFNELVGIFVYKQRGWMD